jgi:GNAT superfamily N-acetyltransferase
MDIRDASLEDAAFISGLLGQLGYPTEAIAVRERLALLGDEDRVLVCEEAGTNDSSRARYPSVEGGFVSLHRVPLLAEGGCCARITALVVSESRRGAGVGRALVEAAESTARSWGCALLEVSSGRRPERAAAHRFYPALGFEDSGRDSVRYWKRLA